MAMRRIPRNPTRLEGTAATRTDASSVGRAHLVAARALGNQQPLIGLLEQGARARGRDLVEPRDAQAERHVQRAVVGGDRELLDRGANPLGEPRCIRAASDDDELLTAEAPEHVLAA